MNNFEVKNNKLYQELLNKIKAQDEQELKDYAKWLEESFPSLKDDSEKNFDE